MASLLEVQVPRDAVDGEVRITAGGAFVLAQLLDRESRCLSRIIPQLSGKPLRTILRERALPD